VIAPALAAAAALLAKAEIEASLSEALLSLDGERLFNDSERRRKAFLACMVLITRFELNVVLPEKFFSRVSRASLSCALACNFVSTSDQ
jgi:hypothetical protein